MALLKPATKSQSATDVERQWYLLDAAQFRLGHLAGLATRLLIGKHKPTYTPHIEAGDWVIVVNSAQVQVSGNKEIAKKYYRHSGYVGNLKSRNLAWQRQHQPNRIVELAVKGMLPKNKLRRQRLVRLKVYSDDNHPHQGQQPVIVEPSQPIKATKLKPPEVKQ